MKWTVTDNNGMTSEPLDTYDLITGGEGFDFHNAEEVEKLFPAQVGDKIEFNDKHGKFCITRVS